MNSVIAVLHNNDIYKKTIYHEFPLVNIKYLNINPSSYDIPMYMPSIRKEGALFCTYEEKNEIDRYYEHRTGNKCKELEEDIAKFPQPIKENNYCQLCNVKYEKYKEHIESEGHCEKVKDNSDLFSGIVNSLKRIRAYWQNSTKETNCSCISDELSIKSTQDQQNSEIERSKEILSKINENDFIGKKHNIDSKIDISQKTFNHSERQKNKQTTNKVKQGLGKGFSFFHKSHTYL